MSVAARLPKSVSAAVGVLIVVLFGFGLNSSAAVAAPFDPAIDQYAEHIPGPGGEDPVQGTAPRPDPRLPRGTEQRLAATDDGAALGRMIERTTSRRVAHRKVDARAEIGGRSGISAILGQLGGSSESGLGPLFIVMMIGLALLIAGGALLRMVNRRSLGP